MRSWRPLWPCLRGSAFTFRTYDNQHDATQRRWGRRSEKYLFGSLQGEDEARFATLTDGTPYDTIFIFDDMGYNFEPSEIGTEAMGFVFHRKRSLDVLPDLEPDRPGSHVARGGRWSSPLRRCLDLRPAEGQERQHALGHVAGDGLQRADIRNDRLDVGPIERGVLERWADFDAEIGIVEERPDVDRAFDLHLAG